MLGNDITQEQLNGLYNASVVDETGEKIGGVGQIYLDDETNRPNWATIKTGLFGTKETFIPLDGASMSGNDIEVPYTKAYVKDAPNIDADHHITPEEEAELYRYYNLDYSAAVGEVDTGPDLDVDVERDQAGSVVRSEEELRVGKERVQTGRVRLRKHVVTEEKTVTVPVQREEYQIETEPLQPGDVRGGTIGADEVSMTLHEERPVVEKDVVAKERVSLGKDVETDEAEVSETLAKEQVEIERDADVVRDREGDRDDRV